MTKKQSERQREAYLRGLREKSNVKLTPMWDHEVNPPKKGPFKPETHKEWKARQPKPKEEAYTMRQIFGVVMAVALASAIVWLVSLV